MRRAAALAVLLAASPALAHERPHGPQTPLPGDAAFHRAQAHDPLDCYCRAKGRIFAPGATVCLSTPQGARMAECRMVVNVMSWGFTEQPCPDS
jgi:hypothetical protein